MAGSVAMQVSRCRCIPIVKIIEKKANINVKNAAYRRVNSKIIVYQKPQTSVVLHSALWHL